MRPFRAFTWTEYTYEAILDATCAAWNALTSAPDTIQSIGQRSWAEVKT